MSLLGSFGKKPKGTSLIDDDRDSPEHTGRLLESDGLQDRQQAPFNPGDRVRAKLPKQDSRELGTCRWVGVPSFLPGTGTWVGIELDKPLGTHSGTVQGREYFRTPPNRAVLVRMHQVTHESDPVPPSANQGPKQTETLAVPMVMLAKVSWTDKDGDLLCFSLDQGKMFYTLNGSKRPFFKILSWTHHKARNNDPGWLEMPDIQKQFAMPRDNLATLVGGLRGLASSASDVECKIGEEIEIKRPRDAIDAEIESARDTASETDSSRGQSPLPSALPAATLCKTRSTGSSAGSHPVPKRQLSTGVGAGKSPPAGPTVAPTVPVNRQASPPGRGSFAQQIAGLEALKSAAAAREDYGEAMRLKQQIEALQAQAQSHVDPAANAQNTRGGHRSAGSLDFDDFISMRNNSMTAPPSDFNPPGGSTQGSMVQAPVNSPMLGPADGLSQATVPAGGNLSFGGMAAVDAGGLPRMTSGIGGSPSIPPPANTPLYPPQAQQFSRPTLPEHQATLQCPAGVPGLTPHDMQSPTEAGRPAVPHNTPLSFSPQASAAAWPQGGAGLQQLGSGHFNAPPQAAQPPGGSFTAPPAQKPILQQAATANKHKSQESIDFDNFFGAR
eukprot:Hpha_TRINITY_DN15549_c5_g1::TRINITY_DN15549_c5_g1_i1::g.107198::m.107198